MDLLRFIFGLPFMVIRTLCIALHWIFSIILLMLRPIIGKASWTPPKWPSYVIKAFNCSEKWIANNTKQLAVAIPTFAILGFAAYYSYHAYLNRPKPIEVAPIVYKDYTASLVSPRKTNYTVNKLTFNPVTLRFNGSVAPIENVEKIIETGIQITPAVEGDWRWQNQSTLVFHPKNDWPINQTYKVAVDPDVLLSPQSRLAETTYSFTTPKFSYAFATQEFYQNPQDATQKNAVFHVSFSHPIEAKSFEKALKMTLFTPKITGGKQYFEKNYNYSIKYGDKKLDAWIRSEAVALPTEDSFMRLTINENIQSSLGEDKTTYLSSKNISVPSQYRDMVNTSHITIVEVENNQQQHVLVVDLVDEVNIEQLKKEVKAWILPKDRPAKGEQSRVRNHRWDNSDDISLTILQLGRELPLHIDDVENKTQAIVSFKFKAKPDEYIYLQVGKNFSSIGGYQPRYNYRNVIKVPDYPKMMKFMSEGSILSMKGEHKVPVLTRNLPGIQLDIKRVIPSQLQHLVSFNRSGEFANMAFNYVDESYFTEHFTEQKSLPKTESGQLIYDSVDLTEYLINQGEGRQGLFLVNLQPWSADHAENNRIAHTMSDSRLILITDLGIIAKKSNQGQHDLFIQSIATGEPVADAKVSVIGQNGIAIMEGMTDDTGHITFDNFNTDQFTREKTPVLFLVEKAGDASFLPIAKVYDRSLELSRFEVGGNYNSTNPRELTGYLFSDRGLYRPGDTVNLGLIVRATDWAISPMGIPMEIEIFDARGQIFDKSLIHIDESGFNEYSFTTKESSPTGNWSIDLYVPSEDQERRIFIGSTNVNVKEFEPDRMKVAITLTPDIQAGWVKPDALAAKVKVETLFGTPAQERRVASTLNFRPMSFYFKEYGDYRFHNESHRARSFEMQLEDTQTDLEGETELSLRLEETADASYHLSLITEAFEAGSGRSVATTAQILVSPYDYLVGVKADGDLNYINKDSERNLHIIAIDPKLKNIALDNLKIERYERKYLSVLTKQDSGVYKYQSKLKRILIDETAYTITEDGSNYAINTQEPGDYELVLLDQENQIVYRAYYTIAGNANVTRSLERNAELQVKLSKTEYKPGEEIEIAINAPYIGSGLITIERDHVYAWRWFKTDTTSFTQTIQVPEEMEGNGYVNIQFVRDANSDEIFMSPLSYSVMPFALNLNKKRASLEVISEEIVKPGHDLNIKVNTNSQQKVVVFAIDEGILQVARYTLQDPLNHFFRKRRLDVASLQILDLILPEFSKIMALTAAPGGDGAEELDRHLNPFKRKREKPVTYWSGIVEVNGSEIFTYPVPDYFNGKLRVMAVSVTQDRIGTAQDYTTVRDDLVLQPNEPYMIAPNDEFEVTLSVTNNIENLQGQEVPVSVTLKTSPQLSVVGDATQSFTLAEKRETMLRFKVKANEEPGGAEFTYHVNYHNPVTSIDETMQKNGSTSVRPLTPYRVVSTMGRMASKSERVDQLRNMFLPLSERKATLSHSPVILMNGLSDYLANSPYQGSEQLISRSFFKLIAKDYPTQFDLQRYGTSESAKLYTSLRTRQNTRGAIGTWRATSYGDAFTTIYAMHYLLEAKAHGEKVPADLNGNITKYLQNFANDQNRYSVWELRLRAYATYLLTRDGVLTTNSLATIQKQLEQRYAKTWQDDMSTMLYLSASYKLLKMDKEAEALLKGPWKTLTSAYKDAWWSHNYYDPLVQNSTAIYIIALHFPEKVADIPAQALENMAVMLRDNRHTTLSSAMSLLAIDQYAKVLSAKASAQSREDQSPLAIYAEQLQDNAGKQEKVERLLTETQELLAQGVFAESDNAIVFKNASKVPAWYSVSEVGYDRLPPQKAISKGLEVSRDYVNAEGKVIDPAKDSVKVGDKLDVVIRIRSNSKEGVTDIALVDLLPGGFEMVQQSPPPAGNQSNGDNDGGWLSPVAKDGSTWRPEYTDIREDRVIIFGNANTEIQSFIYQIRATNVGEYQIPALFGEALYDREIQAVSPSDGVIVVVPVE